MNTTLETLRLQETPSMKFDRVFRLADAPGTGVSCNQNGLFAGETALLDERRDHLGRAEWHARSVADLNRDLSKRYGLPIDLSAKMPAVAAIARAFGRGDLVQAQIAALLLQIPDPPELSKTDPIFRRIDRAGAPVAREWSAQG